MNSATVTFNNACFIEHLYRYILGDSKRRPAAGASSNVESCQSWLWTQWGHWGRCEADRLAFWVIEGYDTNSWGMSSKGRFKSFGGVVDVIQNLVLRTCSKANLVQRATVRLQ